MENKRKSNTNNYSKSNTKSNTKINIKSNTKSDPRDKKLLNKPLLKNNNKEIGNRRRTFVTDSSLDFDVDSKLRVDKEKVSNLFNYKRIPPCKYYKQCGGCNIQELNYEGQLKYKSSIVEEIFKEYKDVIQPIVGAPNEFRYRNKIISTFSFFRGKMVSGIYKENTHDVLPIEECIIEDPVGYKIAGWINKKAKGFKITPYDEEKRTGYLRHILIRKGRISGEVLLVLVVTNPIFPGKNNFIKAIRDEFPEIKSIVLNINEMEGPVVLGNRNIPIFGTGKIKDTLMGFDFELSPSSFYQINSEQTKNLYEEAIKVANPNKEDILLDAYSGIGTISIIASPHVKKVISVELNRDAHLDGIKNSKLNKITNIEFINEDATDYINKAKELNEKIDVVIIDPPRSGSTETFMKALEKLNPKKIVYISCNPHTQFRDIKYLKNYKVDSIKAFDMFPQTVHIETIVVMSKLTR